MTDVTGSVGMTEVTVSVGMTEVTVGSVVTVAEVVSAGTGCFFVQDTIVTAIKATAKAVVDFLYAILISP
jgi:hypothetical protein